MHPILKQLCDRLKLLDRLPFDPPNPNLEKPMQILTFYIGMYGNRYLGYGDKGWQTVDCIGNAKVLDDYREIVDAAKWYGESLGHIDPIAGQFVTMIACEGGTVKKYRFYGTKDNWETGLENELTDTSSPATGNDESVNTTQPVARRRDRDVQSNA